MTGNLIDFSSAKQLVKFWSSDVLTGNQTTKIECPMGARFWSSDVLTGNQTHV